LSTIEITVKALIGLVAILLLTAYPASLLGRIMAGDKAPRCDGPNPVGCLMTIVGAAMIAAMIAGAI
jgi:hypothetical protein